MVGTNDQIATPEVVVMLAAGLGSRLFPQTTTPKPLIKVLGLSLAERVVCTLLGAVTVTGWCQLRVASSFLL